MAVKESVDREVRIFSDPITRIDFEGTARVIKVFDRSVGETLCRVRFIDGEEPRLVERWVDNEQLKRLGLID